MRRILTVAFLLLIWTLAAFGACSDLNGPYTVATLPAAASYSGCVTVATDAANAGTCVSGSGSTVVACRSNGSAWAPVFQPADADLVTYAGITPSANIQTLLGAADYAAMRTQLGLVIGTNVVAWDADLDTYAGITPSANVQTLLGAADYAAFRTSLSVPDAGSEVVALFTGTPDGTKFLRDDGTLVTPSGSGTVNSGVSGCLAYYPSTAAAVDDIQSTVCRIEYDGTEHRLIFNDSAGTETFHIDADDGSQSITSTIAWSQSSLNVVSISGNDTYAGTVGANYAYPTGNNTTLLVLDADTANTGAATLNLTPDGGSPLGAKAVYKHVDGTDIATNDIRANAPAYLLYDPGADSPNGAWFLLNLGNAYQVADADLTTYAGITPAANIQTFLGAADYAAMRTQLGLVIGTNVVAWDADLDTYASLTPSANIQTFLGAADYAAMRTQLGLVIGTNVQAYDADLTTYAGITPSANIQTLLGAADYAAMRTQLGLVIGTNVQAWDTDLDTWATVTPGANVGTFLATPTLSNLNTAVSDATVTQEIASGTAALGTSLIATTACATVVTVSATGTATTDVISWTPNADIVAVTGYVPSTSGGLAIYPYPTTNNVNFKVCNPTASSITPGAVTLNWRVDR